MFPIKKSRSHCTSAGVKKEKPGILCRSYRSCSHMSGTDEGPEEKECGQLLGGTWEGKQAGHLNTG